MSDTMQIQLIIDAWRSSECFSPSAQGMRQGGLSKRVFFFQEKPYLE